MISKILVADFRKLGIACKTLGAVSRSRLSILYYIVMDCVKAIVNGWGMRAVVMTLCKLWTLILYVLRRQLKTVSSIAACLFLCHCWNGYFWKNVIRYMIVCDQIIFRIAVVATSMQAFRFGLNTKLPGRIFRNFLMHWWTNVNLSLKIIGNLINACAAYVLIAFRKDVSGKHFSFIRTPYSFAGDLIFAI